MFLWQTLAGLYAGANYLAGFKKNANSAISTKTAGERIFR